MVMIFKINVELFLYRNIYFDINIYELRCIILGFPEI